MAKKKKKKEKVSSLNLIINAAVIVIILIGLFCPIFKKELEALGNVYATIKMGFFEFTSSVEILSGSTQTTLLVVNSTLLISLLVGACGAVFALLPSLLDGKLKEFSSIVGGVASIIAMILFVVIPSSSDYSYANSTSSFAIGWFLIMGAYLICLIFNGINVVKQFKK